MQILKRLALFFCFMVGGFLGWTATINYIPYFATNKLFDNFRKNGLVHNKLTLPRYRTTKRNNVPMDNSDTLAVSAILDVSDAPQVFEAYPSQSAEYWSVSIFGHNTDTLYVRNDQELPPGEPFRLLIRKQGQNSIADIDDEVVMESDLGFLIVRAIMTDRLDERHVKILQQDLSAHTLTIAN